MKRNFKLISCILALCLNITVLIVAVYGWFISNKNVSSSINGMVVDSIDCVLEFNFFDAKSVSYNPNGQATYTFDLSTKTTSTMNAYDQLGSRLTGKLLEITFKDAINHKMTVNTSTKAYLGATIKDEDNNFCFKKENNPLSSVIMFQYVSSPSITGDELTASMDSTSSFVTDLENNTWESELTLTTTSSNKAYIVLDYFEASIENLYTLNIGNPALDSEGNISYSCDFVVRVS